jgi:lipoprotein-anchoring transpeptidase ErfK/SrfK
VETTIVSRKSFSQRLFGISFITALLCLGINPQVRAVPTTTSTPRATIEQQNAPLSFLDKPQLPPLGDGSKFIPLDPITPVKPVEDVRLVIRLKDRRVYVYRQNDVQTSFPIAVGKAGWETPKGTFKVIQKIKNPSWEHPWTGEVVPSGPDNPLGTRWIGFWTDGKNVIGFHGTPNEESVGRAASHGCVRMFDKDVQVLFEKVDVGTPVIVEP